MILVGDDPARIRSEATFEKLCGVCPIPASSRKTHCFRLNRGGNRRADPAPFRVAVVIMRSHAPTLAYVKKRTHDGKSKSEIIRFISVTSFGKSTASSVFRKRLKSRRDEYRSFNAGVETFFKTIEAEFSGCGHGKHGGKLRWQSSNTSKTSIIRVCAIQH